MILNQESKIPKLVELHGVRLMDEFWLQPFQKGKRELKLTRKKLILKSANDLEFNFQESTFYLPTFNQEKFEVEISAINQEENKDDSLRYAIKSLNNFPIKLNGSFIFHSYLERGDVVEIGLNKLHFKNLKTETYQIFSNEMAMGNLPILIEGETGTGKSYLAKKIHEESARTGEFVHLNLSAFAPSLLESELFGHVKGAFTGAVGDKIGAIKAAEAGTLFLDEIDSVSMDIQIKLLLFLESLEYRPVGSIKNVKANVKVIVASGRSLKELVKANQVRRDFYFRLSSGHIIKLQSLRDDENLIKFYMRKYEEENGILISNNLKEFYMKYSWPGNIRQLYSHLNKKRSLTNKCKLDMDQHDESLLEMEMENGDFLASNQVLSLDKIKEIYCTKIYYKTNRDIKNTSELLQISQNTLRKMIKNHAA